MPTRPAPSIYSLAWSIGLLFRFPPDSVARNISPLYILKIPALTSEVEILVSLLWEKPIPQLSLEPSPELGL